MQLETLLREVAAANRKAYMHCDSIDGRDLFLALEDAMKRMADAVELLKPPPTPDNGRGIKDIDKIFVVVTPSEFDNSSDEI